MEGRVNKVDRSALIKSLLRKVKIRRKEAYIYRGNDMEDEGALWFE